MLIFHPRVQSSIGIYLIIIPTPEYLEVEYLSVSSRSSLQYCDIRCTLEPYYTGHIGIATGTSTFVRNVDTCRLSKGKRQLQCSVTTMNNTGTIGNGLSTATNNSGQSVYQTPRT